MATVTDFSTVTFGARVTKPTRTLFGVLALFEREGHGQFFLQDGTPIGPPHGSLAGALAYGAKKGWKVEPIDADEESDVRPPAPTLPEVPKPSRPPAAPGEEPSRERPKAPRAKKRGR